VERVDGAARVLRVWKLPRSSFYHRWRYLQQPVKTYARRGPKTAHSDAELTEKIRTILAESPFYGEGYRKVWARLRYQREVFDFSGDGSGKSRELGYRLSAVVDGNAGGKEQSFGDSKLPLGGSKSGLPAYLKA
jgi:hypothetical protein